MPNLYILAGCNGAGKTTVAYTLLPEVVNCVEFVNADEIARGLSPFNVESVAIEAGRIMIQRIDYLLNKQVDFALETTLSTRSYVQTIRRAQALGYQITLIYSCLNSTELAKERVRSRVANGGHNIPEDVIERRYARSLYNLLTLYMSICDRWLIVDNSLTELRLIAEGSRLDYVIANLDLWHWLKQHETNH
jgi:predicted ABC-type ATPase